MYKKISELLFPHLLTDSALCEHVTVVLDRAVVKSTFVESKTSPSPNETVKTEKVKNNLLQNHIFNY